MANLATIDPEFDDSDLEEAQCPEVKVVTHPADDPHRNLEEADDVQAEIDSVVAQFGESLHEGIDPLYKAVVNGEFSDGIVGYECYLSDYDWNGWACPYFTKDVADRVMKDLNEQDTPCMHFDAEKDAYIEEYDPEDDQNEYEGIDMETEDGMKHLYPVGAMSWCWTVSEHSDTKEESLHKAELTEDAVVLKPAFVTCSDDNAPVYNCYLGRYSWNGWDCPYFTKDVADEVADYVNNLGGNEYIIFNKEQDQYEERDTEDEESDPMVYAGCDAQTSDGMKHLYPLGSWCWTWEETDIHPEDEFDDLKPGDIKANLDINPDEQQSDEFAEEDMDDDEFAEAFGAALKEKHDKGEWEQATSLEEERTYTDADLDEWYMENMPAPTQDSEDTITEEDITNEVNATAGNKLHESLSHKSKKSLDESRVTEYENWSDALTEDVVLDEGPIRALKNLGNKIKNFGNNFNKNEKLADLLVAKNGNGNSLKYTSIGLYSLNHGGKVSLDTNASNKIDLTKQADATVVKAALDKWEKYISNTDGAFAVIATKEGEPEPEENNKLTAASYLMVSSNKKIDDKYEKNAIDSLSKQQSATETSNGQAKESSTKAADSIKKQLKSTVAKKIFDKFPKLKDSASSIADAAVDFLAKKNIDLQDYIDNPNLLDNFLSEENVNQIDSKVNNNNNAESKAEGSTESDATSVTNGEEANVNANTSSANSNGEEHKDDTATTASKGNSLNNKIQNNKKIINAFKDIAPNGTINIADLQSTEKSKNGQYKQTELLQKLRKALYGESVQQPTDKELVEMLKKELNNY